MDDPDYIFSSDSYTSDESDSESESESDTLLDSDSDPVPIYTVEDDQTTIFNTKTEEIPTNNDSQKSMTLSKVPDFSPSLRFPLIDFSKVTAEILKRHKNPAKHFHKREKIQHIIPSSRIPLSKPSLTDSIPETKRAKHAKALTLRHNITKGGVAITPPSEKINVSLENNKKFKKFSSAVSLEPLPWKNANFTHTLTFKKKSALLHRFKVFSAPPPVIKERLICPFSGYFIQYPGYACAIYSKYKL